jgi:hypothetical protein
MAENEAMPVDDGIDAAAPAPDAVGDADPFADTVDLNADLETQEDTAAVEEAANDDAEDGDGELPDLDEDAGEESGDDEAEPEEVKLHFGGREIPLSATASVKDAADQIQGYLNETWAANTRKTQEGADMRKSAEAAVQQAEKVQTMSDEALSSFIAAQAAQQQIGQLQEQLEQTNPSEDMDRYRILSDSLAMAQRRLEQASQLTAHAEQAAEGEKAKLIQQRHEEGVMEVRKQIKNFDEDAVLKYASERFGIDMETARKSYGMNPASAITMYESMLYRNAVKRSQENRKQAPRGPVKGGVRASSAPAATNDPNAMTDAQFAKHLGLT